MPDLETTIHLVTRSLECTVDGEPLVTMELLMFPELATLANKERQAKAALLDLAEEWLSKQNLDELARHQVLGSPEIIPTQIKVEPRKRTNAWREPVAVSVDAVVWDQGAHVAAIVPALGIAVIAPDREELPAMLREHALMAMKREGWNRSLLKLAQVARGTLTLQSSSWSPKLKSLADRWRDEQRADDGPNALDTLCTKMEGVFLGKAFELDEPLCHLARLLQLRDRPSVLIVGPAGVGKTALVTELARRRADFGFGKRLFYRSSGARLIAGACGFGMWQQRCRELVIAAKEKELVLYLGGLFELMNVGQSASGSESIASFLRPYLVRREAQIVVECTEDQLAVIEKNDPRIGDAFRILRLDVPTHRKVDAILLSSSVAMGNDSARFSKPALDRVAALHRRYAGYAAFPGAPLRFMRRVHENTDKETLIEEAEVYEAFARETGMPRVLLDPALPLDLEKTEQFFRQRVYGQDEAVAAMVALIAQIKAGLTRPSRPLASMLFIGPTGTGKTEMAKTLAEFLFHSPDRMIRLDMSEYGQPWSAHRLVSGRQDGREGILTAAVREQPFSVLLLDEFEKADSAVFDLLLQVLGEARLTDAAGRLADFSNCVVIMTSNLGAQSFSRGSLGFTASSDAKTSAAEHFTSAVQKELRPEMFNRIDRIVPFAPLGKDTVVALTRREIELATLRPGIGGKGIRLTVSERLIEHLAERGYDPLYGARPLKRKLAEELLAPLAARIVEGLPPKSLVHADLDAHGHVALHITKVESQPAERDALLNLSDRIRGAAKLRQDYETLRVSTMVNGLHSRVRLAERLQKALKNKERGVSPQAAWSGHDPQLAQLKACVQRIEDDAQKQLDHEEALMLALHRGDPGVLSKPDPLSRIEFESATLDALALWQPPPKRIVLVLQGQPAPDLVRIAKTYHEIALKLDGQVALGMFYKQTPSKLLTKDGTHAMADAPDREGDQKALWHGDAGKIGAIALWITGPLAVLCLKGEAGLHVTRASRDKDDEETERPVRSSERKKLQTSKDWQCRIDVHVPEEKVKSLAEFQLPIGLLTGLPDLESGSQRRQFDPTRMIVRDGATGERVAGSFDAAWLIKSMREALLKEAMS